MKAEKEYWLARDMDGSLHIYGAPPERILFPCCFTSCNNEFMQIDGDLFPEVTWEGGPKKVKLTFESI